MDYKLNENIILFGFSLILISCSNSGIYRELIQALDLVFTSPKDLPQEAFAEIPYSTIQVRLEDLITLSWY